MPSSQASDDFSPGQHVQPKRPSLGRGPSSSSTTIGRSPSAQSPSHRTIHRTVKHVARGHHSRVAPRNPSVNKDLYKLNKAATQSHGHGAETGKHHRRSLSGSGETTSAVGSPQGGHVKRNASTAVILKHATHTTSNLRKNHSFGHLPRKGSSKAISKGMKPAMKRANTHPHPSRPASDDSDSDDVVVPHPTVRFALGKEEEEENEVDEEAGEEWTEESTSVSPEVTRSNTPAPERPVSKEGAEAHRPSPLHRMESEGSSSQSASEGVDTTGLRVTGGDEDDEDEDEDDDDEDDDEEEDEDDDEDEDSDDSSEEDSSPPSPATKPAAPKVQPTPPEIPTISSNKPVEQKTTIDPKDIEGVRRSKAAKSWAKVNTSTTSDHGVDTILKTPSRASRILVPQDTDNKKLTEMLLNRPLTRARSNASLAVSAVNATGEPEFHAHQTPLSQSPDLAAIAAIAAASTSSGIPGRGLVSRFNDGSASSKGTSAEGNILLGNDGKGKQPVFDMAEEQTFSASAPHGHKKRVGFAPEPKERPGSRESDRARPTSSDSNRPVSQSGIFDLNAGGPSRTQHKLELQRMAAALGPSPQVLPASLPHGTAPPLDFDYIFNHDARVDARLRNHYRQSKKELKHSVRRFHHPVITSFVRIHHLPTESSRARLQRRRARLATRPGVRPSSARKQTFRDRIRSFWTTSGAQPLTLESRRPSLQDADTEIANAKQKRRDRKMRDKGLKAQLWNDLNVESRA